MAEKSLVNEVAETLGVELELVDVFFDDEPQPAATTAATKTSAVTPDKRDSISYSLLSRCPATLAKRLGLVHGS
jgi:hypothetical protein